MKFIATSIHLDLSDGYELEGYFEDLEKNEKFKLTIDEVDLINSILTRAMRRAIYLRKRKIVNELKQKAAEIGAPEAFNSERALAAIEI